MNLSVQRWLMVAGFMVATGTVQAEDLRDPTVAPAEAGVSGSAAVAPPPPLGMDGMAVIVRNGSPHLVVGTRLYAVGQMVGKARLERISETEVWLREGTVVRKIPRFSGIQRTAIATDCKPPSPTAPAVTVAPGKATKRSSAVRQRKLSKSVSPTSPVAAPCTIAQP